MNYAHKKARRVLRKHKFISAQTDVMKIIEAEELVIDEWPFRGRVEEVYLGDSIGIKPDTKQTKKRELIAHALGHHFLHRGNHLYFEEHDQFKVFKQEYEANCFAAELLIPRERLKEKMHLPMGEIATHFNVERDFVQFHLKTLKELCQ